MNIKKILFFTFALAGFLLPTAQAQDLAILQKAFKVASQKAAPSVVRLNISATPQKAKRTSRRAITGRGSGDLSGTARRTVSGLYVEKGGYILTDASHVAGKVKKIVVKTADGKSYEAEILGRDLRYNLVLLRAKGLDLPTPEWADSDKVEVGQFALALGRSYNVKKISLSFGIVSALRRFSNKALQTDVSISPANTGGALVNLDGKVFAIPVVMSRRVGVDSGIGFAIPSNIIQKIIPILKKKKVVKPAFLGVSFSLEKGKKGVAIQRVLKNTAAQKAGLKVGDRIVEIDGHKIRGPLQLQKYLGQKLAGDKIKIKFYRGDKPMTMEITLGTRPGR